MTLRMGIVLVVFLLFTGCGPTGLVLLPSEVTRTKIDPARFEGQDAVVVYDVGHVHFHPGNMKAPDNSYYVFTRHTMIELLTRAATRGDRFGNHSFSYLGHLVSASGEVVKADGKRIPLGEEDMVTIVLNTNAIPGRTPPVPYQKTTLIFPGLEPGDRVAFSVSRPGAKFDWSFNRVGVQTLFSRFVIANPENHGRLQVMLYDRHELRPRYEKLRHRSARAGGTQEQHHSWTARNTPAIPDEALMPPLRSLASRVTLWFVEEDEQLEDLARAYHDWLTSPGAGRKTARKKAFGLTGGLIDEKEKIRVIYAWVKNNLSLGASEMVSNISPNWRTPPIDLRAVLKQRNPGPEKVACLLWTMLHEIGIEAEVVLSAPLNDDPLEVKVADLSQFSRLLLALPDGTLLDMANRWLPFGVIDLDLRRQRAIWIGADSFQMRPLPFGRNLDNRKKVSIEAALGEDGVIEAKVLWQYTGLRAARLRRRLAVDGLEKWLPGRLSKLADQGGVQDSQLEAAEQIEEPLRIRATYRIPGAIEKLGSKQVLKLAALVPEVHCPDPGPGKRQMPVFFAGPWLDDLELKLKLPPGLVLEGETDSFRKRLADENGAIAVQHLLDRTDDGSLWLRRRLSVGRRLLRSGDAPGLSGMCKSYLAAREQLLSLSAPSSR